MSGGGQEPKASPALASLDAAFDRAAFEGSLAAAQKVDLTHPLIQGMPTWPTHPCFEQRLLSSLEAGDDACNHAIGMSEHTGTHFDAPAHFIRGGLTIDRIATARLFCRLVTISGEATPAGGEVEAAEILAFEDRHGRILPGDAVFLHFGWDRLWYVDPSAFLAGWPGLARGAAELLVARGVGIVGSDCLSIDVGTSTDFPAHRILLGAGILVGENFNNLGRLPPVSTLLALPLPIAGGSGAPLRAIALV